MFVGLSASLRVYYNFLYCKRETRMESIRAASPSTCRGTRTALKNLFYSRNVDTHAYYPPKSSPAVTLTIRSGTSYLIFGSFWNFFDALIDHSDM